MNLTELIEALIEIRDSGKAVDKFPVFFIRRRKSNKSIDRVNIFIDSHGGKAIDSPDRIELISLS